MEDESGSSIDSNKPIDLEHDIENQVYNSDTSEVLNTDFEEGLNEGEEVEVSKGMDYKDRFKKGFAN